MDDILDLIQDVAESVALYDLRQATPEAKQLAEIYLMCCERVKAAVGLLTNIKHPERSSSAARRSTASNPTPTT